MREDKQMRRSAIIVIFGFTAVLIVIGTVMAYRTLYQPFLPYEQEKNFTVHSGESFRSVSTRLESLGFIPSATILQLYARLNNVGSSIQGGDYIIPMHLSPVQIVTYLSSGRQNLIKVTIPEGKTIRQVATIFEEADVVTAEEFKQAATNYSLIRQLGIPADTVEGYLFPDTYYFSTGFPAKKIISHMVSVFFEKLTELYPNYRNLSQNEIHEKVIMASIVEREYRAEEEAPLIASVFYNRLSQGVRLESCATVVYVMTEIEGLDHPKRLFFTDLERSSAFNTYYRSGLPPSPISGVGLVSLSAAFFPADSNYFFFVLESPTAERHVFSENYDQHQLASEHYYIKLN